MASVFERFRRTPSAPATDPIVAVLSGQPTLQAPATEVARPRRPFVGFLQILAIVAVIGLAVLYSRETVTPRAPGVGPANESTAAPLPGVRVVLPQSASAAVQLNLTGTVNVRSYLTLTPEITGRVVAMSPALRDGGSFRANEPLLTMDSRDFELMLEQARAEVAVAESQTLLLEAESEAAQQNYALMHPDKPVPTLVAKLPQIAQGRAQLRSAVARASMAELDLARTAFSLPFSGVITEASVEVGQMLNRGQAFGKAFSVAAVEVTAPVAEDDLARLQPIAGRTAAVVAGDRVIQARVERVSAELDQRTRFSKLFLSFAEDHNLKPGAFVDIVIEGPDVDDTYVLPESAEQVNSTVWRVVAGRLELVPLNVLGRVADGLIVSAFDAGQGIVLGPVPGASVGLPVRIVSQ